MSRCKCSANVTFYLWVLISVLVSEGYGLLQSSAGNTRESSAFLVSVIPTSHLKCKTIRSRHFVRYDREYNQEYQTLDLLASNTLDRSKGKAPLLVALISLGITSMLWGSYGIGMKYMYASSSPPELLFNLVAAGVAAVTLSLVSYMKSNLKNKSEIKKMSSVNQPGSRHAINPARLAGTELGGYLFVASTFQIFGLGLTTATHSAFIIQLATVFAPLLEAIVNQVWPSRKSLISCALAFIGVTCLSFVDINVSGNIPAVTKSMLLGDLLSVIAATIYGYHVVRLAVLAPRHEPIILSKMKEQSRFMFAAGSFLTVILASLIFNRGSSLLLQSTILFFQKSSSKSLTVFASTALWQGILVTAVPTYLQSIGQRTVPTNTSVLIYATTPIWATIFEYLIFGERMSILEYFGAALVLSAVLYDAKV